MRCHGIRDRAIHSDAKDIPSRIPFSVRAERIWSCVLPVPFCFMGMGIFRVWTESLYANAQIEFPAQTLFFSVAIPSFDAYSLFDYLSALILIVLALLSKRIAPLYRHPSAIALTVIGMVGCSCLNFATVIFPELATVFCLPSVLLGSLGIALILMLWSEFFGCINPLRVALYYSASIAVGCVILWVFKGLNFWWQWIGTSVVPIISLACLWRAYATLPRDSFPTAYQGKFSFPWKPVFVVAVNTFVYGLRCGIFSSLLAMNSGIGAFLGSLGVYVLICVWTWRTGSEDTPEIRAVRVSPDASSTFGQKSGSDNQQTKDSLISSFDFSLLWKIAMPLMLVSLLPLEAVLPAWEPIANLCALSSYTVMLILIMVILSNLSFQYGVCALWIFAIERAVRLVAQQSGRLVGISIQESSIDLGIRILITLAMAVLLVLVMCICFSEKQTSSSTWGVVFKGNEIEREVAQRNRIGVKCQELGSCMGLTERENEILLLMAQGRTQGEIARDLFIGTNTVKTHIKHIYQKLNVHSRSELHELLGIHDDP
jgi:DNA-binding CsgD family transcriptional regulator